MLEEDETLVKLIDMTRQTNIVALNKTIAAIARYNHSYAASAARCGAIAERMVRAIHEVGMTMQPHLRATLKTTTPQWHTLKESCVVTGFFATKR